MNFIEILTIVNIIILTSTMIILTPYNGKILKEYSIPKKLIDERDIMFSRNLLKPETDEYKEYYSNHPEYEILDNKFRSNPGLLNDKSYYYDQNTFNASIATFQTIELLHCSLDNKSLGDKKCNINMSEFSKFIKKWILDSGANSVGITELKDYHFYTHIGRGKDRGKEIFNKHKTAIAFTIEMNKEKMSYSPAGPTILESSSKYLDSGIIAYKVAEFLKQNGYDSRAHIDGNYRIICPLVASDADLGEIGRMGLLMTQNLGPRVRIAVVTTEADLICDKKNRDFSIDDFCNICKKCAENCPPQAIEFDNKKLINGVRRWQINSEKCFTYWTSIGTDCGRCMRVCPYSHEDNFMHNTVRYFLKRSWLFRRVALLMDDYFYERKPKPKSYNSQKY